MSRAQLTFSVKSMYNAFDWLLRGHKPQCISKSYRSDFVQLHKCGESYKI